ncbi:hypothetical protein ACHHTY_02120, partial [Desulfurivibrio sp. C05AmB]
TAVKDMHRPIYKTGTASRAAIATEFPSRLIVPVKATLTNETYQHLQEEYRSDDVEIFGGHVSSYNSNTYKGRIYIKDIGRPVSFELAPNARNYDSVSIITSSLDANAVRRHSPELSLIYCHAYKNESKSGYLKSLTITHVMINDPR